MMKKEALRALWKRYRYMVLAVLAGILLLAWPTGEKESASPPAAAEEPCMSLADTEERMEAILSTISGVGELHLMLTLESDGERILAQDTSTDISGDGGASSSIRSENETLVLSRDGGDEAVVTRFLYPCYRGALVVCQGGDSAKVKLAVTQAVSSLTGLTSDRITVVSCQ